MIYPGTKLGPYLIDRELGRGGMALVYHAVDERNGGEVALKILAPGHAHDRAAVRRFQQEGEIALRLRHPHIVRAYAAGVLEDYHYIALAYAAQGTLTALVEQRPRPVALEETVQILRRVALALDYAHSRNILHRDVKPSNILLSANGQVWLADFGIARRMDDAYTVLTGSGQAIGTPAFMSPEQVRHDLEIDGRSDIYSLGVVAYQMLSGGLPFEAKTQVSLLHKIAYEQPIPAQTHNSRLTAGTGYVLERVLAKNPAARFHTAATFIDELSNSPGQRPSKAEWEQLRRESTLLPDVPSNGVRQQSPRSSLSGLRRAGVVQGLLVAVVLLLVVGAAAFLLWRNRGTNSATGLGETATTTTAVAITTETEEAPATPVALLVEPSPTATETNRSTAATATPALPTAVAALVTPSAIEAAPSHDIATPIAPNILPTATPTAPAQPTVAAVAALPTATLVNAVRAPTSTPIPEFATASPTPIPSPTATLAPTATRPPATALPVPKSAEENTARITVQLLAPGDGDTVDGGRIFRWQASGTLPAGHTFEPVFWRPDQMPMSAGLGWGGVTTGEQLSIDLTKFAEVQSGHYRWGVLLVKTNPYERIRLISEERTVNVQNSRGSTSDDRGGAPPTPTPRG